MESIYTTLTQTDTHTHWKVRKYRLTKNNYCNGSKKTKNKQKKKKQWRQKYIRNNVIYEKKNYQ